MLKKKLLIALATLAVVFLPVFAFAATTAITPPLAASHYNVNGALSRSGNTWYLTYANVKVTPNTTVKITLPASTTFSKSPTPGDTYNCTGAGMDYNGNISGITSASCTFGSSAIATTGTAGINDPATDPTTIKTTTDTTVAFRLFPTLSCPNDQAVQCWVKNVFQFSQYAILLLATGALIIAGVLYMSSAGNPKMIAQSKKLIIGALSGVAVMVLGRFFLNVVLGLNVPF